MLIIDEVSMISKKLLNQIDVKLKTAKENHDLFFAGIHIVFTGDFAQLPPIKANPLFRKPTACEERSLASTSGAMIWLSSINCCIKLRETLRYKDKQFSAIMHRFRSGTLTSMI